MYMLYLNAVVDVDMDVGSRRRPAYVDRHVDFSVDVKFRLVSSSRTRVYLDTDAGTFDTVLA